MNFEIDMELKKLKEEFEQRILKLEEKYQAVISYKVIPAILDNMDFDYLELNIDEVNKNDSKYIVNYDYQTNKIIVQKIENKSNEI